MMPSWVHWILRNHFRSALKYWSNDKVWIYLKISSVQQNILKEKSCEFISFKSWIDKTPFIRPSSGDFTSILYLNWINFMLTLQGNMHEDQVFKLMLWDIRMDSGVIYSDMLDRDIPVLPTWDLYFCDNSKLQGFWIGCGIQKGQVLSMVNICLMIKLW